MRKTFLIILMVISFTKSFSVDFYEDDKVIRSRVDIVVDGEVKSINMHKLLQMTQMIESSGGRDNYKGRVAKSSYQYEMATVNHYKTLPLISDLWKNIESILDKKLNPLNEEDSKYITYIIYFAKLYYHKNLLNNNKYLLESGDLEWAVYKTFWNSSKGASTYKKWKERTFQLEAEIAIYDKLGKYLYATMK